MTDSPKPITPEFVRGWQADYELDKLRAGR